MAFDVDAALRYMVANEGSDLHLKVGAPPMARVHGILHPVPGSAEMQPEDTEAALTTIMAGSHVREEFDAEGEADLSYSIADVSRFRVNAFRQRGSVSIVCRAIPYQVRTIEDLGLPPVIRTLAEERRGIILLTGTTGSGKSTTLAAMIDHINSTRPEHVITLEDPIEYLHKDKRAIINQREVGSDTVSFGRAMRRVLRQDPDVILIGEMRDEETVRTALSAAETGHLVLSTLHTLDATETINRIIDFFPPHLQQQARVMLASTLKGAVSQRLVPTVDGNGRVAASEILVVTGRVEDLILSPTETGKISQVIAEGEFYGMQTFDQSLLKHVQAGTVSEETAMDYASSPHDFKLMLQSAGVRASDIANLNSGGGGGGGSAAGSPPAQAPSPVQRAPQAQPAPAPQPAPVAQAAPPPQPAPAAQVAAPVQPAQPAAAPPAPMAQAVQAQAPSAASAPHLHAVSAAPRPQEQARAGSVAPPTAS
ncbi:MAG: type IV pilus twitching motility protein PilT [Solirubrobacterales bacterium]